MKFLDLFGALAPTNCQKHFLTLHSLYYYLPLSDFQYKDKTGAAATGCDIRHFTIFPNSSHPSDIALMLAAVVDDLLQIAGLVALAFIIVGSIKFITSEGNPENAANARSTIINALAGLAIAIVGVVFINFIGTSIGR